ncbi:MAG TPA: DNA-binding protein [Burkholderiaceae bacterium]|nr:DNA-binding protein [Burkholderiaceae bacterium]
MSYLPIRLSPGVDLRRSLEQEARALGGSAFVVAGIGSLSGVRLRFAAAEQETDIDGSFEIISLSGTLSDDGAHLHMSVSDEAGKVVGGHVCFGNIVRTTAEVLLVALPDWSLSRAPDSTTGYRELQIRRIDPGEGAT